MNPYSLIGWLTFALTILAVYRGQPTWAIFWLLGTLGADGVTWLQAYVVEDTQE